MEALIDRNTGSVVVLKPDGQPWSAFEREYFKVVQWEDADLVVDDVFAYPYDPIDDPEPAASVAPVLAVGRASLATVDAPVTPPGPSKRVDVNAVDLSGSGTLPWAAVQSAVRTA